MIRTLGRMAWVTGLLLAPPVAAQHGTEAPQLKVGAEAARAKVAEPAARNLALAIDKSHVQLRIPPQELALYDFVVPQATGKARDIRAQVRTEDGHIALDVPPKELVFIRPKAVESLDPRKGKVYASGRMLWSTETGGKATVYRTLFDFENSNLVWSKDDGAYSTRLFVSIEAEDPNGAKTPDNLAIAFTFSLDGPDVRVDPNPLTVTRISSPMQVKLLCARHEASPKVTAKSHYGDNTASFSIVPSLRLAVTASPKEILGFGLETDTLRVERRAEDGRPWADPRPLKVLLSPEWGSVEPKEVNLGPNETTSEPVVFRPSGVRDVKVMAEADGVVSEPELVVLTWPIGVAVCGFIAGAIGGFIRFYEKKKRASRTERAPKWISASLIGGVVGLVLVIAVALGIQSVPVPAIAYSEAGAALIGVLAGYTGTRLLGSLADSMFGGKAAAE